MLRDDTKMKISVPSLDFLISKIPISSPQSNNCNNLTVTPKPQIILSNFQFATFQLNFSRE